MSTNPDLRERYLSENHGSPLLAAVSLTLGFGANRPDDGPEVRLGWPLRNAALAAIDVINDPDLDLEVVEGMARNAAARQGLVFHG